MPTRGQLTGMRGVFLVAAELAKRGFTVTPTARNAQGADLLVFNPATGQSRSVQVKANCRTFDHWLVGKTEVCQAKTHVYAMVNMTPNGTDLYLVPGGTVSHLVTDKWKTPSIQREHIAKYRDNWRVFGKPGTE